jgi:hypothetical protein
LKKIWFLVAVSLIIISFVLVFLFREKPAVISAPDSKSEKNLPVIKAGELFVPYKKENQDPEELDYKTAAIVQAGASKYHFIQPVWSLILVLHVYQFYPNDLWWLPTYKWMTWTYLLQ